MEYVTACLVHEMSKRKKKEYQGDDAIRVLRHGKGTIHLQGERLDALVDKSADLSLASQVPLLPKL